MIGSISYGAPKGGGGSKHIDIYPKGSHGKKTSNAKVAFVLNFGRSNYKGTHWVEAANAAASGPAQAAMEAKFHELFHD